MRKIFSKKEYSDSELMKFIKNSDRFAFRMLYDRYWKSLYAFSCSLLGDPILAKDVLQEVWINFWKRRDKIVNENIKAYLFQSIRYGVYYELRKNKKLNVRLEVIDNIISSNNISDLTNLEDLLKRLDDIICKLSPRNQEIFKMSRFDCKSNQEISEELGISKRTVENSITNALRLMRKEL